MESLDKAKLSLRLVGERKAVDPLLFQVKDFTSYTDYLLIAGGTSSRQVQAIARHLQKKMREAGFRPYGVEGEEVGQWVLVDYGDVVVHIFYQPVREFYDLEGLWIEAPRVPAEDGSGKVGRLVDQA
jgi:ribosome-associated protein